MLTLRSKVKIIWFEVNMEHILPEWKNRQKPVNIERFPDSQKSKCSMLFLRSVYLEPVNVQKFWGFNLPKKLGAEIPIKTVVIWGFSQPCNKKTTAP